MSKEPTSRGLGSITRDSKTWLEKWTLRLATILGCFAIVGGFCVALTHEGTYIGLSILAVGAILVRVGMPTRLRPKSYRSGYRRRALIRKRKRRGLVKPWMYPGALRRGLQAYFDD